MKNKRILLPNKKYVGSPDKDIQIKVGLENNSKTTIEGSYSYTINSNEQYTTERQYSNLFRPYLKISGLYYSNAINSPFIDNYSKTFNTNYYLNKQNIQNPNDNRNFTASINTNTSFVTLTTPSVIPFNNLLKDSNPSGYNIGTYTYTTNQNTLYSFGTTLRLNLKNNDVNARTFKVVIKFVKNNTTTEYFREIYNGNINGNTTIIVPVAIVTSGITLDIGSPNDSINVQIEESNGNGNYLDYNVVSTLGFITFPNLFYGAAQDINSLTNSLSNVDFLYDPIKTVANTYVPENPGNSKSVIFSITAPYDDIIITNISPLTTISSERRVELLDYWYLPTDIKRDGSYTINGYTNYPGNPIIVTGATGWINIGTFFTGTTESDFTKSNDLRTNLYTFRGNMNIKIPKYHTYSFFVMAKNGEDMTSNELLTTVYGKDSIAGFMTIPESMPNGDIKSIKDYQQYCWLNVWPDSFELTATTNSNVSLRDYYGWSNNLQYSPSPSDPYTFPLISIVSGDTEPYAFKGIVNYKIVQREPYTYRTQRLLSYEDYYDSVVPDKQYLEYIDNEGNQNWDMYSTYPYDRDDNINLYIVESGLTNTFKIGNGIPAKCNVNLTLFEISASTNTVFNSYFNHNLKIGDYVKISQVSGTTTKDLGTFPVVSVGKTNNSTSGRIFTIKLSGFTGTYIQFKRILNILDSGSISQYYVRKYKIIENNDNYTLSTPLSRNGFGNNYYYLTNKSEIDIGDLYDENSLPITNVSYFFKKRNNTTLKNQKITLLKNNFYDEYYGGRSGFIGKELYTNITNFFITGDTTHQPYYGLGLMLSGLTNTYRNGSLTPNGTILNDDVFVFESDSEIKLGSHIEFIDSYPTYSNMSGLTQSIVYRSGDDFNYKSKHYFSLFSQYTKKPIGENSGNTLTLLGVKPTLNNFIGSKIAGSTLYPTYSMIYINNQISNFPIGSTILYTTANTDTIKTAQIVNYELGGTYATINTSNYAGVQTTGSTSLYSLQYYGDSYNIKFSDMNYNHYSVYYLDNFETKIDLGNTFNIGDSIYGDIVEYNQRELNTYVLQTPSYLFKLDDINGSYGSTPYSAITSTYGKTDLLYPIRLRYFTDTIYSSSNVEDKKSWAIFNTNLNLWEWRDLIPNGDFDQSGNGTDFPFLNGRHYIYNDIILPIRSKHWNPIFGNQRSLRYNSDFNFNNTNGTLQSINDIEIC